MIAVVKWAIMQSSSDSEEELDLSEIDIFATKPRKRKDAPSSVAACTTGVQNVADTPTSVRTDLKERIAVASLEAGRLRQRSAAISRRTEQRRRARERRRQLAANGRGNSSSGDPVEENPQGEGEEKEWQEVRPFLTVNDHLTGAVPQGSCGPKTELESLVEGAIAEGDFDKAEMLSDHLANRQFAVKIANAFAAKRYASDLQDKRRRDYVKRQAKLAWGFETKERWQMKGNM